MVMIPYEDKSDAIKRYKAYKREVDNQVGKATIAVNSDRG